MFQAIECGHKEVIQLMLERGVDINTIDYEGNSGLHVAAKQGFYEITSMLLKQGANFESSNNVCISRNFVTVVQRESQSI